MSPLPLSASYSPGAVLVASPSAISISMCRLGVQDCRLGWAPEQWCVTGHNIELQREPEQLWLRLFACGVYLQCYIERAVRLL